MNKRHSTSALVAAALVGAAAGAWLSPLRAPPSRLFETTAPSSRDDAGSAAASSAAARVPKPASPMRVAEAQALAQGAESLENLQNRARTDPEYLASLLARLSTETELDARGALLAILAGAPNAQLLAYARAQLDGADAQARRNGLDLLKMFPMNDADARDLVTQRLERESDPAALKSLIEALTPSLVAEEDAAPVIARLADLSRHADADVRAQAVLQYAQWDNATNTEVALHRALNDPALAVRRAAIAGAIGSSAQSARMKLALIDIATDPAYDDADRASALFALQRYPLNRAEHALYAQSQAALDARH
ncbi:hypothetical protein [Tahibacter soli]|uniref:HEAT repeat protein n=1 Tax=Tahibacter soli TaxID=2983605 RepID=A0A9X3YGS3_9GAMM|nr:hypothetical protein [Tahibacter soli]MDC8011222.1 hypothetical protein [Tahibacter soli]